MARVITIAHQKGGVGKTSIAINLYMAFKDDLKTVMVDFDPQGSVSSVAALVEGLDVISFKGSAQDLRALPYDVVIVDTPPYLTANLPAIFAESDFVLIPTKTGYLDAIAIKATVAMVKEAQATNPRLKAGIVLNMVKPRTSLTDEIRAIIEDNGLPVLAAQITDRVSYTRSPMFGGVFAQDDERAKDEINTLVSEILDLMSIYSK
jgi:chromosome partitioning protein